jgi:transposase
LHHGRQPEKNDAADAEAIAEAATRATMRFVAVKTEAQQASAMAYRTRDLFVRQRTQTINALRGHLAEFGVVAPIGIAHLGRLAALVEGEEGVLPEAVAELARMLLDQIEGLSTRIDALEKQIRERAAQEEAVTRLMTMPGIGAITATALVTFAPAPETFAKGRDFAAWVGLTPRQHSSGGRERLGRITRMGQRDIRRLLITGAVGLVRWAARKGAPEGSWLARMMAKKPRMLVAVALANRMARMAWAMMRKNESYRVPAVAA